MPSRQARRARRALRALPTLRLPPLVRSGTRKKYCFRATSAKALNLLLHNKRRQFPKDGKVPDALALHGRRARSRPRVKPCTSRASAPRRGRAQRQIETQARSPGTQTAVTALTPSSSFAEACSRSSFDSAGAQAMSQLGGTRARRAAEVRAREWLSQVEDRGRGRHACGQPRCSAAFAATGICELRPGRDKAVYRRERFDHQLQKANQCTKSDSGLLRLTRPHCDFASFRA